MKVEVEIECEVCPQGKEAHLERIEGLSDVEYLCFGKDLDQNISSGTVIIKDIISLKPLLNAVDVIGNRYIHWRVRIDGKDVDIGRTGPHTVYVTYDKPSGGIESNIANEFVESLVCQDVTVERLEWSVYAARGTGSGGEKECVDAIFMRLLNDGVRYTLGYRWEPEEDENHTGITPKPTLHQYLWMCNAREAKGECHNLAAGFILACKIIGVKGKFEVGYMYPWPSREDKPPDYPKRGDNILGRYNLKYKRVHESEGHGEDTLIFLDSMGNPNNYEGVAKYGNTLYAIGEVILDTYDDPDMNASCYFAKGEIENGRLKDVDLTHGGCRLVFRKLDRKGCCYKPYPWMEGKEDRVTEYGSYFYWEE